ncbi:MAG: response regulator [Proteobacteria bacterium]|nr:response regulator [Pseudomonadota bacterium]
MPKTVLIVEDNKLNMKLFVGLLQESGYETVQSADGRDVVDLARQHKPNLILMDIQLPETSGLECTLRLKVDEDLKDIPVIAVTAFNLEGGLERIFAAGCAEVISKPIDAPLFLKTVATFIS